MTFRGKISEFEINSSRGKIVYVKEGVSILNEYCLEELENELNNNLNFITSKYYPYNEMLEDSNYINDL